MKTFKTLLPTLKNSFQVHILNRGKSAVALFICFVFLLSSLVAIQLLAPPVQNANAAIIFEQGETGFNGRRGGDGGHGGTGGTGGDAPAAWSPIDLGFVSVGTACLVGVPDSRHLDGHNGQPGQAGATVEVPQEEIDHTLYPTAPSSGLWRVKDVNGDGGAAGPGEIGISDWVSSIGNFSGLLHLGKQKLGGDGADSSGKPGGSGSRGYIIHQDMPFINDPNGGGGGGGGSGGAGASAPQPVAKPMTNLNYPLDTYDNISVTAGAGGKAGNGGNGGDGGDGGLMSEKGWYKSDASWPSMCGWGGLGGGGGAGGAGGRGGNGGKGQSYVINLTNTYFDSQTIELKSGTKGGIGISGSDGNSGQGGVPAADVGKGGLGSNKNPISANQAGGGGPFGSPGTPGLGGDVTFNANEIRSPSYISIDKQDGAMKVDIQKIVVDNCATSIVVKNTNPEDVVIHNIEIKNGGILSINANDGSMDIKKLTIWNDSNTNLSVIGNHSTGLEQSGRITKNPLTLTLSAPIQNSFDPKTGDRVGLDPKTLINEFLKIVPSRDIRAKITDNSKIKLIATDSTGSSAKICTYSVALTANNTTEGTPGSYLVKDSNGMYLKIPFSAFTTKSPADCSNLFEYSKNYKVQVTKGTFVAGVDYQYARAETEDYSIETNPVMPTPNNKARDGVSFYTLSPSIGDIQLFVVDPVTNQEVKKLTTEIGIPSSTAPYDRPLKLIARVKSNNGAPLDINWGDKKPIGAVSNQTIIGEPSTQNTPNLTCDGSPKKSAISTTTEAVYEADLCVSAAESSTTIFVMVKSQYDNYKYSFVQINLTGYVNANVTILNPIDPQSVTNPRVPPGSSYVFDADVVLPKNTLPAKQGLIWSVSGSTVPTGCKSNCDASDPTSRIPYEQTRVEVPFPPFDQNVLNAYRLQHATLHVSPDEKAPVVFVEVCSIFDQTKCDITVVPVVQKMDGITLDHTSNFPPTYPADYPMSPPPFNFDEQVDITVPANRKIPLSIKVKPDTENQYHCDGSYVWTLSGNVTSKTKIVPANSGDALNASEDVFLQIDQTETSHQLAVIVSCSENASSIYDSKTIYLTGGGNASMYVSVTHSCENAGDPFSYTTFKTETNLPEKTCSHAGESYIDENASISLLNDLGSVENPVYESLKNKFEPANPGNNKVRFSADLVVPAGESTRVNWNIFGSLSQTNSTYLTSTQSSVDASGNIVPSMAVVNVATDELSPVLFLIATSEYVPSVSAVGVIYVNDQIRTSVDIWPCQIPLSPDGEQNRCIPAKSNNQMLTSTELKQRLDKPANDGPSSVNIDLSLAAQADYVEIPLDAYVQAASQTTAGQAVNWQILGGISETCLMKGAINSVRPNSCTDRIDYQDGDSPTFAVLRISKNETASKLLLVATSVFGLAQGVNDTIEIVLQNRNSSGIVISPRSIGAYSDIPDFVQPGGYYKEGGITAADGAKYGYKFNATVSSSQNTPKSVMFCIISEHSLQTSLSNGLTSYPLQTTSDYNSDGNDDGILCSPGYCDDASIDQSTQSQQQLEYSCNNWATHLNIARDETTPTLYLRVFAKFDNWVHYDDAEIHLSQFLSSGVNIVDPAEVDGVKEVSLNPNSSYSFNAVVTKRPMDILKECSQTNQDPSCIDKDHPVIWSVLGGVSGAESCMLNSNGVLVLNKTGNAGTCINPETGELYISPNETAYTLKVVATSKYDTSKYDTATVNILSHSGGAIGFVPDPATGRAIPQQVSLQTGIQKHYRCENGWYANSIHWEDPTPDPSIINSWTDGWPATREDAGIICVAHALSNQVFEDLATSTLDQVIDIFAKASFPTGYKCKGYGTSQTNGSLALSGEDEYGLDLNGDPYNTVDPCTDIRFQVVGGVGHDNPDDVLGGTLPPYNENNNQTGTYFEKISWDKTTGISSGRLHISKDESANQIYIIATSISDPNYYASLSIEITNRITSGITIIEPSSFQLAGNFTAGSTVHFKATTAIPNSYQDCVIWKLPVGVRGSYFAIPSDLVATASNNFDDNGSGWSTVTECNRGDHRIDLVISPDETNAALTIEARLFSDQSRVDIATVNIAARASSGIVICPIPIEQNNGFFASFPLDAQVCKEPKITMSVAETHHFFFVPQVPPGANRDVIWELSGGVAGTFVDQNGNVTIAHDETNEQVVVSARLRYDSSRVDSIVIFIVGHQTMGVAVQPKEVNKIPGTFQLVMADVSIPVCQNHAVSWNLYGGSSSTSITPLDVKTKEELLATDGVTETDVITTRTSFDPIIPQKISSLKQAEIDQIKLQMENQFNALHSQWEADHQVWIDYLASVEAWKKAPAATRGDEPQPPASGDPGPEPTATPYENEGCKRSVSGENTFLPGDMDPVDNYPGYDSDGDGIIDVINHPSLPTSTQTSDTAQLFDSNGNPVPYLERKVAFALVQIDPTESSPVLYFSANSLFNPNIFDAGKIVVQGRNSTGVIITPKPESANSGDTINFHAIVNIPNLPTNSGVDWSVHGGVEETTISDDGVLEISRGETGRALIVMAISRDDKTRMDLAIIPIAQHETSGVTILTKPESIGPNQNYQFEAECFVPKGETKDVVWEIGGNEKPETTIDRETGFLSVAEGETSKSLFITARSVYDPTMFDFHVVSVVDHFVTQLSINPSSIHQMAGTEGQFTAVISVPKNQTTAVDWEVRGSSPGTTISDDGKLTIGADEKAQHLVVVATAKYDSTVAFALVSVVPNTQVPEYALGDEMAYLKNFSGNITFTTNELLPDNLKVAIDGQWVHESDFSIKNIAANEVSSVQYVGGLTSASANEDPVSSSMNVKSSETPFNSKIVTTVTVSEKFMNRLEKGNHTIALSTQDASRIVPIAFRVFEQKENTGITPFKITLFILLFLLTIFIICCIIIYNKRRNAILSGDIENYNEKFAKFKFLQIRETDLENADFDESINEDLDDDLKDEFDAKLPNDISDDGQNGV